MTFEEIRNNENIKDYIREADHYLGALGYTEHGFAHVGIVVKRTEMILRTLGFDEKTIELAKIFMILAILSIAKAIPKAELRWHLGFLIT